MAQNYHSIKATLSTNLTSINARYLKPFTPIIYINFGYETIFVFPQINYYSSSWWTGNMCRELICTSGTVYSGRPDIDNINQNIIYDINNIFNKDIELKIYDYGDNNKTGYLKIELIVDGITKEIKTHSGIPGLGITTNQNYQKQIYKIGFALSDTPSAGGFNFYNEGWCLTSDSYPIPVEISTYLNYPALSNCSIRYQNNITCSISNFSFESTLYQTFVPIFNNKSELDSINWEDNRFGFTTIWSDYPNDLTNIIISNNKIESNNTFSILPGLKYQRPNAGHLSYIPLKINEIKKLTSLNKNGNILLQQADSDAGTKNISQQSSYNFLFNNPSTENKISNSKSPSLLQQNGKLIDIYYDSDSYNIVLVNSNDFGVTWGTKMTVVAGIMPSAFIFNNILYLFYGVANGSNMDLKLIKSINGGATWGSPISIVSNISKQYITAVSAENSAVKIFYSDSNNNIVDLTSRDIGVTWA